MSKSQKKQRRPTRPWPEDIPRGAKPFSLKVEEAAFMYAVAFQLAAMKLRPNSKELARPTSSAHDLLREMIPFTVNESFATELYLKTLLLLSIGDAPFTHNVADLFDALPTDVRLRIKRRYRDAVTATMSPKLAKHAIDLEAVLADQEEAFKDFRYGFQTGGEHTYLHGPLNRVLMEVIVETKPEWKTHTLDPKTPST